MKAYKEKINHYYKYVMDYLPFDQPAPISSLGGSSFGCTGYATGGNQSGSPQAATYPNKGSFYCYEKGGQPGMWFYYYTPSPTKISGVQFHYSWGGRGVYAAFYGSNTNGNWTTLVPQRPCGDGTTTLSFENETPYQYYHLYLLTPGGGSGDGMSTSNIRLYGTEYKQTTVEVTAEDEYDFIVEGIKTYVIKEENVRKYYKYEYSDWIQPVISSNGTIGGSSFAVSALNTDSRTQPYYAFDSNLSDTFTAGWLSKVSNNYLEWYNPKPLNISQLQIQYQTTNTSSVGYISSWVIKASSNGENFIDILSGTTGNYGITNISIEHSGYYKYWRFYPINWSSEWYDIINMQIAATEQSIVGGTADDYDFYEDVYIYKAIKS